MSRAGPPLLAAHGIVHEYGGGVRALAGVDLVLHAGELLVVCGPNGAGKSTLLAVLAGTLHPTAGEVLVQGRPLAGLRSKARARLLARVPQTLAALPTVTARHFVLSGRYAHIGRWRGPTPDDWRAVEQALADADVSDLPGRALDELSGGQRQRVLLARALAGAAPLLLVDEPTAGLDPGHQVAVLALVRRLVDEGKGALVVTHDLNLASQFAHTVALLDAGRMVTSGPPDAVLRPEVLAPVYGEHLHYGRLDGRPFVLPWLKRAGARGPP